jgi:hypothetical protein
MVLSCQLDDSTRQPLLYSSTPLHFANLAPARDTPPISLRSTLMTQGTNAYTQVQTS